MPMTAIEARAVSNLVLDTVEGFLDTAPDIEHRTTEIIDRSDGEEVTVRMMRALVDGEPFLIQCKRGGWVPDGKTNDPRTKSALEDVFSAIAEARAEIDFIADMRFLLAGAAALASLARGGPLDERRDYAVQAAAKLILAIEAIDADLAADEPAVAAMNAEGDAPK